MPGHSRDPLRAGLSPERVFNSSPGPETVRRILKTRLGDVPSAEAGPLWSVETLGLERSTLYRSLDQARQERILQMVSDVRIQLSCLIERAGIAYCAKMSLLSEDQATREAYLVMGRDEVEHHRIFQRFLSGSGGSAVASELPLVRCLEDGLENGGWATGVYVLQVLLEGFGLWYYSSLLETTSQMELKLALKGILADEASHHGLGCALLSHASPSKEELEFATQLTGRFVKALADESPILLCFERALGSDLDARTREGIARDLELERTSRERLLRVRQLVERHNVWGVLDALGARGVFT